MAEALSPAALAALLKARVRTVRGWPKPGVNFRDVTPLFQHPATFRQIVAAFAQDCAQRRIDVIAAVDARGFIAGGALAYELGLPFALVRKKGKLPFKTLGEDYALEYGTAAIEVHADACRPGDRVLITDDLLATGGTLLAAGKLFRALGAEVVGVSAIIDLPELGGSRKLREAGYAVHALCAFNEVE
jgi:adenine phosphoribosyltransferase